MVEERPFSDISYDQFLKEEKLMGSKCNKCGALFAPPRGICTKCYSSDMKWVELKGKGKLLAYTVIYVGAPIMIQRGYDRKNPYVSGVVELDEGVRVDARIEGVDVKKPEQIKIGTPLKVKYLHYCAGEDKETVLAFEPV